MKLSICIATYNRADVIRETLDSIVPQLRDDVELIILDGASTDNTPEVVMSYLKNHHTKYIRMPEKGGLDRDFCHAVSFATGEYVWLFSDDDVMKHHAINDVLPFLDRLLDLIVINAEVWDRWLTNLLQDRRINEQSNLSYGPHAFERFFVKAASYLSFIGAVVIKRSVWNERAKELYIGTEFTHFGVIFQKPLDALIIAEPYIKIRYGNACWSNRHFTVWQITWPKIIWSLDNISDKAKALVTPREPWRNPLALILLRAQGTYSYADYKKHLKGNKMALAISLLPGRLVNLLMVAYYSLTEHDEFEWYNLRNSRYYLRKR